METTHTRHLVCCVRGPGEMMPDFHYHGSQKPLSHLFDKERGPKGWISYPKYTPNNEEEAELWLHFVSPAPNILGSIFLLAPH